jgi:hypothetical protein
MGLASNGLHRTSSDVKVADLLAISILRDRLESAKKLSYFPMQKVLKIK